MSPGSSFAFLLSSHQWISLEHFCRLLWRTLLIGLDFCYGAFSRHKDQLRETKMGLCLVSDISLCSTPVILRGWKKGHDPLWKCHSDAIFKFPKKAFSCKRLLTLSSL